MAMPEGPSFSPCSPYPSFISAATTFFLAPGCALPAFTSAGTAPPATTACLLAGLVLMAILYSTADTL